MSTLNDKWIYESPDGGKTIIVVKLVFHHLAWKVVNFMFRENLNIIMIMTVMGIRIIHSLRDLISSEIETTWAEMDAMEPLTPITPLGTPKKVWIAEMDY